MAPQSLIPRVIVGDDPAAGAEVSVIVPGGRYWLVKSIEVLLVTDATVASRQVRLTLDDVTSEYFRMPQPFDHTAGATVRYTWAAEMGAVFGSFAALAVAMPFPGFVLPPLHRIRTSTTALQAGDNYGAPNLYVVEYPSLEEALRGFATAPAVPVSV